jgi:hypothetical protein
MSVALTWYYNRSRALVSVRARGWVRLGVAPSVSSIAINWIAIGNQPSMAIANESHVAGHLDGISSQYSMGTDEVHPRASQLHARLHAVAVCGSASPPPCAPFSRSGQSLSV